MQIVDTLIDVLKLFILFIFCALLYCAFTPTATAITYYITPSDTNPEFKPETRRILQTSSINARYNIQEVDDPIYADITLELRDTSSLDAFHLIPEYYPNTQKQIRFSLTWQIPKPYIAIDKNNWTNGVPESKLSLQEYRNYVIRHEFMHGLGFNHQPCNANTVINGVCPVLYQATRGPPDGYKCGQDAIPIDFTKKLPNAYIKHG